MEVSHPLIRGLEERKYQLRLLNIAIKKNTLICLPTGMGKTNIAILLAANRIEKFPDSKVLVIAPTKPLVSQHQKSFLKFLNIEREELQVITGIVKPSERIKMYEKKIIFATPQTIQKDLENERFSIKKFSLLVIDEIHHAVGKYSYPYIAKRYVNEGEHPRILGLTASPGSSREKVNEICKNTGIEAVEIATEKDEDVFPYVKEREVEWVDVMLPESFVKIKNILDSAYQKRVKKLGVKGRRELLWLQKKLQGEIKKGNKYAYGMSSTIAQAIKIEHASALLETQSISVLRKYLLKLREDRTRAAKSLLNDSDISRAFHLVDRLYSHNSRHPKMGKLYSIVEEQFSKIPNTRIIIFANYRETVREINEMISSIKGCRPVILVGQREGISQRKQLETVSSYESGEFNCLVTTSVGEEGLDLEEADLAVFYETVPSEIRQIQRRGRVGRARVGRVVILVTKGTRDEAYRWAAHYKEKQMKRALHGMKMKQARLI